jgi:hypothetical protein
MAIGNGLFSLAQTLQTGQRQAYQNAGGLFESLGNALSPIADMNLSDPTSVRAAAEGEARRGNQVKANALMQQANQIEQRQEAERVKNIQRSYAQMKALGREGEFEDAMIQAGRVDEIAAIKRKEMEHDILTMEYGDAKRARKARELSQGYFQAQTEEGRDLALQRMAEEGFGEEAAELKERALETEIETTELKLRQAEAEWKRDVQRVRAIGVPRSEEEIEKVRQSIDPSLRGIYDQQVVAMQENRVRIDAAREKLKKSELLDQEFVEKAGLSWSEYKNLANTQARDKVNQQVIENYMAKMRTEASTLPNGPAEAQLSALYDSLNEVWGPNRLFREDLFRPQAIQLAWTKMQQEGLGAREAMDQAIAEIAGEEPDVDNILDAIEGL